MPIYDYVCKKCDLIKKDIFVHDWNSVVKCSCNEDMKRLFPTAICAHVFPAEGITLEHVAADPVTFYSKNEMRRYAKEHNLELGALL